MSMRKWVTWWMAMSVVAGAVQAAVVELDMDLMQTIEDTNKSLASNIAIQDVAASTREARELHELFRSVEAHYVNKPEAVDGLELSRKSLTLTSRIAKLMEDKDFTGASESATELSRTCRACHTFYKKS